MHIPQVKRHCLKVQIHFNDYLPCILPKIYTASYRLKRNSMPSLRDGCAVLPEFPLLRTSVISSRFELMICLRYFFCLPQFHVNHKKDYYTLNGKLFTVAKSLIDAAIAPTCSGITSLAISTVLSAISCALSASSST